ncbi:hypothetical protein BC834DRAFT_14927 [Gloeopeniophorella convolvens]|nr:hypothetical protein BC834DRAFT_14927 [Gloeopeniophorella convolvens]
MPSEIDDIFARKGKASVPPAPQPSALKQKKRKKLLARTKHAEPKRPAPEVVLDPSTQISQTAASNPPPHDRLPPPAKKRKAPKSSDTGLDQDNFGDSRGTGPRRKTEEGFSIFKEDELGISAEAGGTPLCPFDCNCF